MRCGAAPHQIGIHTDDIQSSNTFQKQFYLCYLILTLHTVLFTWSNWKMTAVTKQKMSEKRGRATVIRPNTKNEMVYKGACSGIICSFSFLTSFWVCEFVSVLILDIIPAYLKEKNNFPKSQYKYSVWKTSRSWWVCVRTGELRGARGTVRSMSEPNTERDFPSPVLFSAAPVPPKLFRLNFKFG